MSEFAQKVYRQAQEGNIKKETVDKLLKLKKLTQGEYDTIIKVFENEE